MAIDSPMDEYFDTTDIKGANNVGYILKHGWDVPLSTREFYKNSDDRVGNRCKEDCKQQLFDNFLKDVRDPSKN